MKFIIVFAALFAVALAAPPSNQGEVQIVRSDSNVGPESFEYGYETSDGVSASAEGHLNNAGTENEALAVRGSYTWVDPEGQSHTLTYIADENGFQPQGADIPVAPAA
ncbi:larval cuticle protein 65Ag1-like [Scaptodrosophila lebanonensis]|uniref:Larval cuticle protein 65Ag1-like n=1 Tax=Drosophila lebanonensis TaxID=7225 RepID=A0A6J2UCV8_DROLE|nr:larval cuticle protein 65Ag1-like [Scaptodrosophila lebanonensis]